MKIVKLTLMTVLHSLVRMVPLARIKLMLSVVYVNLVSEFWFRSVQNVLHTAVDVLEQIFDLFASVLFIDCIYYYDIGMI